jgi:hypothetical protein
MLHSNLFTEARSLDVVGCALQHERGDIDCRDAGPEAARNPDRRSAHPTTHVEDALVGSKVGATNQFVRGRPAARVNDSFAQYGKESVRIQLLDLTPAERAGPSHNLCSSHDLRLLNC